MVEFSSSSSKPNVPSPRTRFSWSTRAPFSQRSSDWNSSKSRWNCEPSSVSNMSAVASICVCSSTRTPSMSEVSNNKRLMSPSTSNCAPSSSTPLISKAPKASNRRRSVTTSSMFERLSKASTTVALMVVTKPSSSSWRRISPLPRA